MAMGSNQRAWAALALGAVAIVVAVFVNQSPPEPTGKKSPEPKAGIAYKPRKGVDTSGFTILLPLLKPWKDPGSLEEIAQSFDRLGFKGAEMLDRTRSTTELTTAQTVELLFLRSAVLGYEGQPRIAYQNLAEARALTEANPAVAEEWLYTLVYCQGIAALRLGEDENCILCRGESSCIIPIAPAAVHTNKHGSQLAIKHFMEYLEQFPEDLGVRWLLNVAHMTLGEFPEGVDRRFVLSLDSFFKSEFDIGKFRDIGHLVGVNRLNQAGGAIMDDFDNDGMLDIVITTMDATQSMAFFRNKGDGTFEDVTRKAGLGSQLGGLNCVQTDYNNDGHLDILVLRGAWMPLPMRPSLLRNNGNGTFTDVTKEAGMSEPINCISGAWADFDNDGFLDLFVCCERQHNKLYRNKGNGTFEEIAQKAGVAGNPELHCKGVAWIDFDNDGYPDLFITNLNGTAQLFRNNRNGTFADVTASCGISGPQMGFSCWAWDYDNDGFLDIFATSYDRTVDDLVKGLVGESHRLRSTKLYRNLGGKGFADLTKEAGLDKVFATMGSNFGDFDNDGYLDFYLGTGDPKLGMLVPNRMFKNVDGKRFAEITSSSGTGHLQKGHGVACGDWDRDGNIDIFIEMGGAVNGDKYHNILFQNPGHNNNWLTIKLIGTRTNRAAIGARIKVVTDGERPLTVHRHVSSGSSFGANPLQQTIGIGRGERIALLEIVWPTSGEIQTFRNVAVNQAIEVTESAKDYRRLNWTPIAVPK